MSLNDQATAFINAFCTIIGLAAVIWVVEVVNWSLGHPFDRFGIYPRELTALPGILFWPFLHANFQHLVVNTTPLLVLGFFVALRGWLVFVKVCLCVIVLGGTGVFLFARPAFHLGASGLVFGFFGFLIAIGIYEKSLAALGIASFTIFYYGGMLVGIVPAGGYVSFEAHFFGLVAGVFAARLFGGRRSKSQ